MTGLSSDQVDRLVLDVYASGGLDPTRRRVLGPYRSVLVVLLYLRHNVPQALIAELFGCSQPTASRLVGRLLPIITAVLTPIVYTTAERELRSTVRVDGFLVPTGNWRNNTFTSGTYSGKRHACGFNLQAVGSWHETLVLTGTPMPGAMHDARAWRDCGLAQRFEGRLHADGGSGGFADTAYTGTGACAYPTANPRTTSSPSPPATSTAGSPRIGPASNASSPICKTGASWPPVTAACSIASTPSWTPSRSWKPTGPHDHRLNNLLTVPTAAERSPPIRSHDGPVKGQVSRPGFSSPRAVCSAGR